MRFYRWSFVDGFRNGLPEEVSNDPRYSFRVYLVPKVTAKPTSGDVAVEFVPYDPKATEDMEHLKKVVTLLKERQVPVANVGYLKPAQVVAQVKGRLAFPSTWLCTCARGSTMECDLVAGRARPRRPNPSTASTISPTRTMSTLRTGLSCYARIWRSPLSTRPSLARYPHRSRNSHRLPEAHFGD